MNTKSEKKETNKETKKLTLDRKEVLVTKSGAKAGWGFFSCFTCCPGTSTHIQA